MPALPQLPTQGMSPFPGLEQGPHLLTRKLAQKHKRRHTHACIHTHKHAHPHTHARTHARTHTHTHAHMHAHTHARMQARTLMSGPMSAPSCRPSCTSSSESTRFRCALVILQNMRHSTCGWWRGGDGEDVGKALKPEGTKGSVWRSHTGRQTRKQACAKSVLRAVGTQGMTPVTDGLRPQRSCSPGARATAQGRWPTPPCAPPCGFGTWGGGWRNGVRVHLGVRLHACRQACVGHNAARSGGKPRTCRGARKGTRVCTCSSRAPRTSGSGSQERTKRHARTRMQQTRATHQ